MVSVPVTTRNSVEVQPLGNERLRYTAPRNLVGPAMQGLGEALGGAAQAAREIEVERAENEALTLDVEHIEGAARIRTALRQTRGMAATEQLGRAQTELDNLNASLLERTSSPIARRRLQQAIAVRSAQELSNWSDYALGQEREAGDTAAANRAQGMREAALDMPLGSVEAEANLGAGIEQVTALGRRQGWDESTLQQRVLEYRSGYHASRVNQMFQGSDPEAAQAYLDSHREEMTVEDEGSSRALIRGELLANQQESDAAMVLGQVSQPAPEGEPPPPPGEARWRLPVRTSTTTVPGGRYGAPRSYGVHRATDYAASEGTPVYPMAEGTVTRVTRTGGGGNTIEIDYGGGYRSRYLHLQNGSVRVREGQRVGPDDIVAGIGNTGSASRGNHLHAELHTPNGRVDPSTMAGGEAPRLPAASGQRIDLAEAYRRIDSMPGWTESRRRRAREGVRQYAAENDQVRARVEADADRALTQSLVDVTQSGRRLTSLTQLPADALRNASPSTVAQLQAQIEVNNRRAEPQANSPLMAQMIVQAGTDPNGFMREVNPEMMRGRVTDAEVEQLHRMRLQIQQNSGAQPSEILGMIRFVLPTTGLVQGRTGEQRSADQRVIEGRLLGAVERRLRRTHGVENIQQADILRAVQAELTMVTPTGEAQSVPMYEARRRGVRTFSVSYPTEAEPFIDAALQRAGLPVTPNNRAVLYMENREEFDRAAGR